MNAVIGSMNVSDTSVISRLHPPIMGTMKAKAANGTLAEGLVVAKDSNGDLVAYDPVGLAPLNTPVGILVHECDTTKDDAAVVLKHGTAVKSALLVGASAPDAADLAKLEAIGVFAV